MFSISTHAYGNQVTISNTASSSSSSMAINLANSYLGKAFSSKKIKLQQKQIAKLTNQRKIT
ncbi:hypothetical protein DERP_008832 [Dermatophagoides pteronyssinus]|uniref:Uncharacterized protein n=1 Tax=Dermatophagoides pteronyssinus TaxID=6956 RepID=A0ABQ8IWF6_DERPT|nr:hypothetical protein DERP_008832 [Dermatophagoides pteronyssinus]